MHFYLKKKKNREKNKMSQKEMKQIAKYFVLKINENHKKKNKISKTHNVQCSARCTSLFKKKK